MKPIWNNHEVQNFASRIAMGPFGSDIKTDNFVDSGVPVIRGGNLTSGRFNANEFVYLTEEKADDLKNANAFPGDLVFTHRGTLGQVGIIPEQPFKRYVVSQSQMLLRCDPRKADPYFVYYFFKSPIGQHALLQNTSQTGVPAISRPVTSLKSIRLPLPPLPEQKRIAHILGTLDDKIELNRKMNATLEAMARALFKSWFVDFDPVRAKMEGRQPEGMDAETAALFPDELVESELGLVPKGWEIGLLGKFLETQIGGDWGEDSPFEGAIGALALRGVDLQHIREQGQAHPPLRWVKEASLTKRQMSSCDILIASSGAGPCGRSLWVNPSLQAIFSNPLLYSNFCKRYRASTPHHALYFDRVLVDMRESGEIWEFINGTSLPNLDSGGLLKGKSVLAPPVDILESFGSLVQPVYGHLYSGESHTLATLRDTLLPKLLSGEPAQMRM